MTNQNPWIIEKARSGDAGGLATFAAKSFRDAFGSMNEPADVDAYCARAFTPVAQARELADPVITTLLAWDRGEIIAYAQLQEGEPHPGVSGLPAILLKRIYVDQKRLGMGVGKSLMKAVAREAGDRGARTLWLTVWEQNPRAIRFYSSLGMTVVGEADFLLGSDLQRDLVMAGPVDVLL